MLRVIKQKANDGLIDSPATRNQVTEANQNPQASNGSNNVVSHVPSCVSLGGSVLSSNSSIASDKPAEGERSCKMGNEHVSNDLQPNAAQLNASHGDSVNDESPPDSCPDATIETAAAKSNTGSRKVSFSQSDLGTGADVCSSPKRPRLDSSLAGSTQVMMPIAMESRVLTMSEDADVLNALHLFIRAQIEVFTATPSDIALPAPGRKIPIQLHQVGLRCIHCRHLPARNRVKRAVCYPSSVGRVYNSVSDMKFDHFNNCRGFPPGLRSKLKELMLDTKKKVEVRKPVRRSAGCSSSTAQYYHDAARKMGMVDGNGRIFMIGPANEGLSTQDSPPPATKVHNDSTESVNALSPVRRVQESFLPDRAELPRQLPPCLPHLPLVHGFSQDKLSGVQQPSWFSLFAGSHDFSRLLVPKVTTEVASEDASSELILLATPLDSKVLNPLHCWVRQNIEIFAANKDDLAVPAPGRKTRVLLGQVGIRCIQCVKLPLKDRVKRCVCYPPSVNGIYHSVSNMKFDHFSNCRGLSREARAEFSNLKSSGSRRGGGGSSGSTAQYYYDSAVRLGLIDTDQGIRFGNFKSKPNPAEVSAAMAQISPTEGKSVADGISALMFAASNAGSNSFGV